MADEKQIILDILDMSCGPASRGNVTIRFFKSDLSFENANPVQRTGILSRKIENVIVADFLHLPFRAESFNLVYSSRAIVNASNPFSMLREMCRVAKRKVIVVCPHRKSSGSVKSNELNNFDEAWFKQACDLLGFRSFQFIVAHEHLVSIWLKRIFPVFIKSSPPWRILLRFERSRFMKKFNVPTEMEIWIKKERNFSSSTKIKFVVVYNIPKIFKNCFSSSRFIPSGSVVAYYNKENAPLPKFFNKSIQENLNENTWFVFCHQDFILNEDLSHRLHGKEIESIYGPIGARVDEKEFSGMIIQSNFVPTGRYLEYDAPVQTLDEMCLIVHSELFRQGLLFDERFSFHFYGADLCLQAYAMGFDIQAMQLRCQHKSRTLGGDLTSPEYLSSLDLFKTKWKQFSPIKTTTKELTSEE